MLTFDDDIGGALRKAFDHDSDHDALQVVRAAKVVRREMFNQNFTFNGSFSEQSGTPITVGFNQTEERQGHAKASGSLYTTSQKLEGLSSGR